MLVQPTREVPIKMVGGRWPQKHTDGSVPPTGPWWVEWTALRREQSNYSNARPVLKGRRAR
jgi:hypothetical protein